jgi:hypothetical protein
MWKTIRKQTVWRKTMCNVAADVMTRLENTVRQFLDEGRMFTGYDVTLETRNRDKIKLRHSDCRGAVHDMQFLTDAVDFGHDVSGQTVKWNKTQIDMGNGAWAFVYHPDTVDPNGYQARQTAQTTAPSVQTTPTVATVVDDTDDSKDSGGENNDGTFTPDYRNRLFIKVSFVRSIGLKPGDDVIVIADMTKQSITLQGEVPTKTDSGITVSTQRVERNGDFRLSSATLRSAGLTCSKFKIEKSQQPAGSGISSNIVEIFAA